MDGIVCGGGLPIHVKSNSAIHFGNNRVKKSDPTVLLMFQCKFDVGCAAFNIAFFCFFWETYFTYIRNSTFFFASFDLNFRFL